MPFTAHPEVWVLVVGVIGLGLYAVRVVGPVAVRDGSPVVTGRQARWFAFGVLVLWLASDWPVHDIAEDRLYWVHMVQHLLITFVVPPVFLLATPTWLVRLVVGRSRLVRRLTHPVVAGVLFNGMAAFTHWQLVVNTSADSGPFHYVVHVLLVGAAVLMWMPVCGPVPELRLPLPGQMVYLFLMSIVPTVPAAWLTFADGVVYEAYGDARPLWGFDPVTDQQLAGLVMKLVAGMFLWGIIIVLFFKWAGRNMAANRVGRTLDERQLLMWDDVKDELHSPHPT